MKMSREDASVIYNGIVRYCAAHWMYEDVRGETSEEDEYVDTEGNWLDDRETVSAIISFLQDVADCCEEIAWSINTVLEYLLTEIMPQARQPEAFYTGGGFWLSAVYVDEHRYYVVENEFPECLTMYDHRTEDDDSMYPCQNMVDSKSVDELTPEERKYHDVLLAELKKVTSVK